MKDMIIVLIMTVTAGICVGVCMGHLMFSTDISSRGLDAIKQEDVCRPEILEDMGQHIVKNGCIVFSS